MLFVNNSTPTGRWVNVQEVCVCLMHTGSIHVNHISQADMDNTAGRGFEDI